MSLGLVVLEKKLFTWTRMQTPQSDDIMSADIKNQLNFIIVRNVRVGHIKGGIS